MKKLIMLQAVFCIVLLSACSGKEQVKQDEVKKEPVKSEVVKEEAAPIEAAAPKEEPVKEEAVKAPVKEPVESAPSIDVMIEEMNSQLAKVPFEGFAYKSAEVPSKKYDKWAASAAPVIKSIIDKLPEKHVLQITGNTDNRGPENAAKGKKGNIKLSEKRAKAVYDALQRKGIKSPKMTYKGAGSSMLKSGVPGNDPSQRRVTFQVVPE